MKGVARLIGCGLYHKLHLKAWRKSMEKEYGESKSSLHENGELILIFMVSLKVIVTVPYLILMLPVCIFIK